MPDGEHGLLQFVLRLALALLPDDGGQAAQVQLAVGGERHLGQPAEARRHHVFGQALAGPLQQGIAVGLPCPGLQTGVSEQAPLLHHHLDLADGRAQFGKPGLYLTRLDAIAAQLDLLVYPAQILDVAVAAQQGPIAGAIEAMGSISQRQLDKGLLSALWQIEVAASQPQPCQAELAGDPHRAEVARLVQDQRLQVVDGSTYGDGRPRGEPRAERGDGALGRAVHVEQRHPLPPALHQAARARLAAKADGLEGTEIRRWQQVREQGGRQNHMAGTASDRGTDHPLARLAEVQGRAAVERQQAGHVARIKREGHAVEHGAILIKGDALAVIRHQVDQAALLHHDPLGQAGAAGGVDDLGQHGGVPGQCGRAGWHLVQRQLVQVVVTGICALDGLGKPGIRLSPEHQRNTGVAQDMGQPLGGIGRVERHIGRPRLPAGEQGDDEGDIAPGLDADGGARGDALSLQPVGQPVGTHLQLAIGQRLRAVADRQRVRQLNSAPLDMTEQGVAARVIRRQVGKLGGQRGLVGARLQRQLPDVGLGGRHHGAHQVQQAIGISLDGLSLEQGGGEQPVHPDGVHQLGHLDRDVGLGRQHRRGLLHQLAAGDEIVEVHLGLIDQHDLEDGVDGGGAIGADGLGQRLEAVELVIEGRQILLPALLQIVDKAGLAAELSAQHQGIDEKAHQRLDLVALAIGERGADHHLLLAALAHHQQGKQGVQTDEVGGAVALTEALEALPQVALDGGEDQLAAAVLMGRARLVERQTVHLGAATEPIDPERLELGVIIEKTR